VRQKYLDNSNVAQHAKVSKNVSVSAYRRLGLGLGLDLVKSGKVSVSVSSRVGSQTSRSRLGLGPQRLVYIPALMLSCKHRKRNGSKLNTQHTLCNFSGTPSRPRYKRLLLINCRTTSSEAIRPIFPKIAFTER